MRAVVQRVTSASVAVAGDELGRIGHGLLIFVGVGRHDGRDQCEWTARKIAALRIFDDGEGRMNRSLVDVGGEALVISQFTLFGSVRKGSRPSFNGAAAPDLAIPLYTHFVASLSETIGKPVATGKFGAYMEISADHDGPVTLVVDTEELQKNP